MTQRSLSFARLLASLRRLPKTLRLYGRLLRDGRVPRRLKLYCAASVLYLLSPLDALPDFLLPFLGQMDDLACLWWAFGKLVREAPPGLVEEHRRAIDGGRPPSNVSRD